MLQSNIALRDKSVDSYTERCSKTSPAKKTKRRGCPGTQECAQLMHVYALVKVRISWIEATGRG